MPPLPAAAGAAPARAALAGNPSDGYGGAVLAVCLPALAARVRVAPAPAWRVDPPDAAPLVRAAAARYARALGADAAAPLRAQVRTSIPREVGLAGSSAIVVATLRALGELWGAPVPPEDLARVALAAETEELGIAAGLQDRVAQVHGGLVLMDFARDAAQPEVEELDPGLLPDLLVAWHPGAAAPSGRTHAGLRERALADPRGVAEGMGRLAGCARAARDALVARDASAFAAAMDLSFDARARLVPHAPAHLAMIAAVREAGGAANSTGSGGAVVGALADAAARATALARLRALGCGTLAARRGGSQA